MADVEPLLALHYDLVKVGGLQPVAAPPYDVIDSAQRAALLGRSPYNVVEIDLPFSDSDPYAHAAQTLTAWTTEGIVTRDNTPALWALAQDYTGPDGRQRTRHGVFARVRVEDYGPGRIRPHERTHPGPKEDRLRLTRATRTNLSPIFSLYDDPQNAAWKAIAPFTQSAPWGEVSDDEATTHKLWRVDDPQAIEAFKAALSGTELLIADGHHRYETARVYQQENPAATHVLMCLVALQDEGLTVFPTHRLATNADMEALTAAFGRDWTTEPRATLSIGYYANGELSTLYLKDWEVADAALIGKPEPYRRLDTAVLEKLILMDALGLTEDDISHLHGLDYARTPEQAKAKVDAGEADAAFLMNASPVERVRDVAVAGENMPPKSTYFFPKVLTGMVFNPLED
ncbi:DUF1015 domain-containing protein [Solirubrobacter sp. CPCC 204708]|uniref:DUF1015 domain-containing protein n=1 Tax=Solirubrobacter deserti TaxID=2282478 RepID=A0ABT4RID4_9ACTN|nr:DUF1015 domain-containing protein [Solirubrobacter deserti]MBE2320318.1 DUF1015 domain-containing protein [Solirubrobacter deserti]MDA0138296.1 DUF1015 domain-containing protein [Solirubrobacter deserti]